MRPPTSPVWSPPSTGSVTAVPTYVMLSTIGPDGWETVSQNPDRITAVTREVEAMGCTVVCQYAVMGQYDFVNIIEAPDEHTIARVSLELGSRGTAKYETLSAIPVDDFIGSI